MFRISMNGKTSPRYANFVVSSGETVQANMDNASSAITIRLVIKIMVTTVLLMAFPIILFFAGFKKLFFLVFSKAAIS